MWELVERHRRRDPKLVAQMESLTAGLAHVTVLSNEEWHAALTDIQVAPHGILQYVHPAGGKAGAAGLSLDSVRFCLADGVRVRESETYSEASKRLQREQRMC